MYNKTNDSFTTKEVILLTLTIIPILLSFFVTPYFTENSELSVTIFEWKMPVEELDRDPGAQILVQNTGTTTLHDVKILLNTNSAYRLDKFVHLEGILSTTEYSNDQLVITVSQLAPYSFFTADVSGEVTGNNRKLIVSSNESQPVVLDFPVATFGGISTQSFIQVSIVYLLVFGLLIIFVIRVVSVLHYEKIRKSNLSFDLKRKQINTRRSNSLLFIFEGSIIALMFVKTFFFATIPFQSYSRLKSFEWNPQIELSSFILGSEFQYPQNDIFFIAGLVVLTLIILVNSPTTSPKKSWKPFTSLKLKDISGSYATHQVADLSTKYKSIKSNVEVVLLANKQKTISAMFLINDLENLNVRPNTTFLQILQGKNPQGRLARFRQLSSLLDRKIFERNYNVSTLDEILDNKRNFLKLNSEQNLQKSLEWLENASMRFGVIQNNDDTVLGVIDSTLLK